MDIIKLLPENIANQIAAGEVIQRPASAVKEMLENALDSGATSIKLLIKDAGKTLIQVIDNGCGMSEKDATISFERHATSKISKTEDLFNIQTMGFRGEAMASMAAISHIELITKLPDEELGTKILIEGSEIKKQEKYVCPNGTSIKIKNLFYNVPARRKFLKSDKIESKHIVEQFTRIALANPELKWSLFIDDKEYFRLEISNFRQRIVNIIGNRTNEKLVPVIEKTNLVNINGYIGKPEFSKKTRGEQYFFVNGRFIKSHYLHHAISRAFKDLIVEGYHPTYFLNLNIDPKQLDINIHPTKTEIKFEDEQSIYAIIRSTIKKSLGQYNIAPTIDFNTEPAFVFPPNSENRNINEPTIKVNTNYNPFVSDTKEEIQKTREIYQEIHEESQVELKIKDLNFDTENYLQIGTNFIATLYGTELIIIHQQRAHQRVLYEYFKKNETNKLSSQKLIFPQNVDLTKKEIINLSEIETDLINIGFDYKIEEESIKIHAVPPQCINENIQQLFDEILRDNDLDKNELKEKFSSKLSKTLAKSLSIKQGKELKINEMKILVKELMNCNIPSISPFGKTTYFNVTDNEIYKKFN